MASTEFRKATRCREVLRFLYELRESDQSATVSDKELAKGIGLPVSAQYLLRNSNIARAAVQASQKKLAIFQGRHPNFPVAFELSPAPYQLTCRKREIAGKRMIQELVPLVFNHRENTLQWFQNAICESADVLFVTVGNQHTLNVILPWFQDGLVKAEHFRVLTWRPGSIAVAEAFVDHIEENAKRFMHKQDDAWDSWKEMEEAFEMVEVYGYSSVPTMQAICSDERSLKVELFPFNRRQRGKAFHGCGSTARRAALLIDATTNPSSYWFFKDSFEDLWIAAMRAADEDKDVHPRWHLKRRSRLTELGLILST